MTIGDTAERRDADFNRREQRSLQSVRDILNNREGAIEAMRKTCSNSDELTDLVHNAFYDELNVGGGRHSDLYAELCKKYGDEWDSEGDISDPDGPLPVDDTFLDGDTPKNPLGSDSTGVAEGIRSPRPGGGNYPITPYKNSWADKEARRKAGDPDEVADMARLLGQQGSETSPESENCGSLPTR